MTREEIIKNLKYTMEKHKNDNVSTFETNISVMCEDILDYLEQEPKIDYRRAFKIACELLSGSVLYGVDTDRIFEIMMQKDGVVSNESYEEYILNHLQELDHGQYEVVEE